MKSLTGSGLVQDYRTWKGTLERRPRMRSEHLGRALGSDHRATTDFTIGAEDSAKDGDVSAAWAIAFVVCALLALVSPFH